MKPSGFDRRPIRLVPSPILVIQFQKAGSPLERNEGVGFVLDIKDVQKHVETAGKFWALSASSRSVWNSTHISNFFWGAFLYLLWLFWKSLLRDAEEDGRANGVRQGGVFSLKHSEEVRRDRSCAVKLLDWMFANRIGKNCCIQAKCLLLDCALQADSQS